MKKKPVKPVPTAESLVDKNVPDLEFVEIEETLRSITPVEKPVTRT